MCIRDSNTIVTKIGGTDGHDVEGNTRILLNNDSKRAFPCDCDQGTVGGHMGSDCSINSGTENAVASACWAARNLHCPYLASNANDVFTWQAQLKFLFERNADLPNAYLDPGELDGVWGRLGSRTGRAMSQFRIQHAAEIYGAGPVPADPATLQAQPVGLSLTVLNTHAPYPRILGDTTFDLTDK